MGNADSINRAHVLGGIEASMAMSQQKPFEIPKHAVWDAYRRVAANKDAPGVDGRTLEQFEADLGATCTESANAPLGAEVIMGPD